MRLLTSALNEPIKLWDNKSQELFVEQISFGVKVNSDGTDLVSLWDLRKYPLPHVTQTQNVSI